MSRTWTRRDYERDRIAHKPARIICPSGKARWSTEAEALRRLAEIHGAPSNRTHVPTRAYPCHLCGGWHLTSAAKR